MLPGRGQKRSEHENPCVFVFANCYLDVVKTRQLERAFADGGFPSVGDVAQGVYEEGPDVLFSGSFERVLRSAPQFGVTLALYDVLTQYCVDHGWLY